MANRYRFMGYAEKKIPREFVKYSKRRVSKTRLNPLTGKKYKGYAMFGSETFYKWLKR